MNNNKRYSEYFRPIEEHEMKEWKSAPKSFTTELFEEFLRSEHEMVEINIAKLQSPKHKKSSKIESTKLDSFASSFYSWKKRRKKHLQELGVDILLVRRGERMALKKKYSQLKVKV